MYIKVVYMPLSSEFITLVIIVTDNLSYLEQQDTLYEFFLKQFNVVCSFISLPKGSHKTLTLAEDHKILQ